MIMPTLPHPNRAVRLAAWVLLALIINAWCQDKGPLALPGKATAFCLILKSLVDALRIGGGARLHRPRIAWLVTPLMLLLACKLYPLLMLGFSTMTGWDFPVHTWHAHELATELFPSLRGWTFTQGFGWPEGDVYALGAYVPAALLNRITFHVITIEQCVAIEVAVVTVLPVWIFRRWLGSQLSPFAALGGCALLLDPGVYHQGGMIPLLVAGMWPVRLSIALSLASVWAMDRFMSTRNRSSLAIMFLVAVFAANTHIAGVTYLAFVLLAFLFARHWSISELRTCVVALAVMALAMLSTSWMVIPFYAQREYLTKIGEGLNHLQTFVQQMETLSAMDRTFPVELALSLAGAIWLAARGQLLGRFALTSWFMGFLWINSDLMLAAVTRDEDKETILRFQWPRYESFGRCALLFCGGVMAAQLIQWILRRAVRPSRRPLATMFWCATFGLLYAAYDVSAASLYDHSQLKRDEMFPPLNSSRTHLGCVKLGNGSRSDENANVARG